MKKTSLLLLPLALLVGCADTQPMPHDPGVARRIERMDGGRGDVPTVNHPNLDPNRGGYYDNGYDRPYYNNGYNDGYYRNGNGHRYYR